MTKLAMRRAWFQVHKWIGLILAVLIIPVSLTGSALVWDEGLARMLNPQRYAVSGDSLLAPGAYVVAARAVLRPGDRIASLQFPADDGPVIVSAAPAQSSPQRPGPPQRTSVWLDPPTARILDVAPANSGLIRTLHQLHGSLMVPGVGRTIVGWIGVAMMVSCFTGLWLWWPTVGAWVRGFRWRRHRHADTNIHYLFGFWVALPLFVLSLTGAWISFPQFFGSLTGGMPQQRGPDRAALMRAKPFAAPRQTLEAVLATASKTGRGELRQVVWPTDVKPEWAVSYASGEGRPKPIAIADADGRVVPGAPQGSPGGNGVAQLMRRVHDGSGMGMVWQLIIFIGGILPAVLAVTGIIMWWRARGWKAELAAKRRARQTPLPAE